MNDVPRHHLSDRSWYQSDRQIGKTTRQSQTTWGNNKEKFVFILIRKVTHLCFVSLLPSKLLKNPRRKPLKSTKSCWGTSENCTKRLCVTLTFVLTRRWSAWSSRLLRFAAPVQSHIRSFVFERSQERFLLVVQTGAGFTVMDQDVTHELHLPLLRTRTVISVVSTPYRLQSSLQMRSWCFMYP